MTWSFLAGPEIAPIVETERGQALDFGPRGRRGQSLSVSAAALPSAPPRENFLSPRREGRGAGKLGMGFWWRFP